MSFMNNSFGRNPMQFFSKLRNKSGFIFGAIILTALGAFEIFNYSTTDFALRDLLGELKFIGLQWSTILTIAFCAIDFAGIARIFTPQHGSDEPKEVWYLFGAWLLAATMNAALTWWGVAMAIANHKVQSTAVIDAGTIHNIVPIFVAIMVWVIRILIIGSLSYSGDRIFSSDRRSVSSSVQRPRPLTGSLPVASNLGSLRSASTMSARPTNIRSAFSTESSQARPEPTYHSLAMNARAQNNGSSSREDSTVGSRHL